MSVQGTYEPIIEKELFFRVLDRIEGRANKVSIYKKVNADFIIRGLVICEVCGHKFTGGWSKGKRHKYAYYRCKCRNGSIPRETLESKFYEFFSGLSFDRKFSALLKKIIQLEMENRNKFYLQNQISIDTRIEELKKKRKQIIQKSIDNILPDKDAKELLSENERQVNLLQIEKRITWNPISMWKISSIKVFVSWKIF